MKFKSHFVLLIWMIIGSAVLVNQVSQPIALVEPKEEMEQTADSSRDADEATYVLQANVAINSFSPVTLHQELHQIREIILDEVADPQEFHVGLQSTGSENFKTLYSQLISPNGP